MISTDFLQTYSKSRRSQLIFEVLITYYKFLWNYLKRVINFRRFLAKWHLFSCGKIKILSWTGWCWLHLSNKLQAIHNALGQFLCYLFNFTVKYILPWGLVRSYGLLWKKTDVNHKLIKSKIQLLNAHFIQAIQPAMLMYIHTTEDIGFLFVLSFCRINCV